MFKILSLFREILNLKEAFFLFNEQVIHAALKHTIKADN